jgi:anthranilate phosphoribosyltransferase
MLIGVPKRELCESLARVLQTMGVRRAMVVCGAVSDGDGVQRYLDEVSPLGPTTIAEFYHERGFSASELSPESFPLQPATLSDLRGGNLDLNARIVEAVLNGSEQGPKRDAVLLNAAAALFVGGAVLNLEEGWQRASEVIDSGKGLAKLQDLRRYKQKAAL